MMLHELQPKQKQEKRVGRGGRRGKTSGAGHKGQKARSGTPRPALRDIIKKIPKLRGHGKNRARTVNSGKMLPKTINLSLIDTVFESSEIVNPQALLEKGLVTKTKGRIPAVKVLGTGELTKKLTFSGCSFSKTAQTKIVASEGTMQ